MNPVDVPSSAEGANGWNEWSRYVLSELKRLNAVVEDLRKEVAAGNTMTRADIAGLKVQAGIVGLIGGIIPAVIVFIYFLAGN